MSTIHVEHDRATPVGINTSEEEALAFGRHFDMLSVRARNALKRAGLNDISKFKRASREDLSSLWSVGQKTVSELLQLKQIFDESPPTVDARGANSPQVSDFFCGFNELSERAKNSLRRAGLDQPAAFASATIDQIHQIRGVGRLTILEIQAFKATHQPQLDHKHYADPAQTFRDKLEALLGLTPHAQIQVFDSIVLSLPKPTRALLQRQVTNLPDLINLAISEYGRSSFQPLARALLDSINTYENLRSLNQIETSPSDLGSKETSFSGRKGQIAERLLRIGGRHKYSQPALAYKFGLKGGFRTLEEVGAALSVTRERVRQVLVLSLKEIESYPGFFSWCREILAATLQENGGVMTLDDLEFMLTSHRKRIGDTPLLDYILAHIPGAFHSENGLLSVGNESWELLRQIKKDLLPAARRMADDFYDDQLWSSSLQSTVLEVYKTAASNLGQPELEPSMGVVVKVLSECEALKLEQERVYSSRLWHLKFGRVPDRIDALLLHVGKPMHHSEIVEQIAHWSGPRRINPLGGIERSPNVILWDKGTYVHRDLIDMPYPLLDKISDYIRRTLTPGLPFISVAGVFNYFEEECLQAGLPTRHALYGCLRASYSGSFSFSEYPYVRLLSVDDDRPTVLQVIEDTVRAAGGPIARKEVERFLKFTLGINPDLIWLQISNAPNVLFASKDLLHVDNFPLPEQAVTELKQSVRSRLETEEQVHIKSVLNDNRVSALRLRAEDPRLLHSVLLHCGREMFRGEYPYISMVGSEASLKSGLDLIADFVYAQTQPCPFSLVRAKFIEEHGHSESSVNSAYYHSALIRFAHQSIVHLSRIGWTEGHSQLLAEVASSYYNSNLAKGRAHARISDLLDDEEDQLPTIEGVPWTPTLLANLLRRTGGFILIGTADDAFVPIKNRNNVANLQDVCALILMREYSGACDLKEFEERLKADGLIAAQLRPSMLNGSDRVVIEGDAVLLRGGVFA